MITPNSKFIVLKSPIELDNLNQLTFENVTDQYNYFYSLTKREYDEVSFVRKDNIVVVETDENFAYDDLLTYNYCMYQNTSYGDKWFYAFIEDCNYLNDGACELKIKTDVYQTWQFDIQWKQTFIEREHIAKSDDVAGVNVVPENLETGEYIDSSIIESNELTDICPVVSINYNPISETDSGTYRDNIYQAYGFYIVKGSLATSFSFADQVNAISSLMKHLANKGRSESVLSLFMAPKKLVNWQASGLEWSVVSSDGANLSMRIAGTDIEGEPFSDLTTTKPTSIDGYTPINKKVLTFPYCYLTLSNNSGNVANYYYEDFSNNNITFNIKGSITPSCSIKAIPTNYKGLSINYSNSLNLGKYPICSWNSDVYINWLTQNAVNIPVQIIGGTISTLTGLKTKSAVGTASGILAIADSLGKIYEHSLNPIQTSGDTNSGDVNVKLDKNTFTLIKRNIKQQFARKIDSYFNMYGYATNELKLPNLNNRSNWNFVKTINCNILGDIPQKDIEEIKTMFNNGLTLWHNPNTFLDYSQSNN